MLCDGTYGFLSLSEKTRKSNRLQMSLQRQHFLPSVCALAVDDTCEYIINESSNQISMCSAMFVYSL